MKNLLALLAKSEFIPLEITARASALDSGIHKKSYGLGLLVQEQHWKYQTKKWNESIDKRSYSND